MTTDTILILLAIGLQTVVQLIIVIKILGVWEK